MLIYGFDKILKSHFPFPTLEKLIRPLGESSPQALLWTFMGYSKIYTFYLGAVEVLSGMLLLFKRTSVIGAILAFTILINVFIINYSYDVPVKLFATNMCAFIIYLISPFLKTLHTFFILRNETKLDLQTEGDYPKFIISYKKIIKTIIIIFFTLLIIQQSITKMNTFGDGVPTPVLYGIYQTQQFQVNADSTSTSKAKKWEKLLIDKRYTTIIKTNNERSYYQTEIDTAQKIILFKANLHFAFQLNYKIIQNNLYLNGMIDSDSISVQLKKFDLEEFPLIKRKFYWIEEFPYNN